MRKIIKSVILCIIVFCTISPISFAVVNRPANAKGTVTGSGTEEDPFQLVLGEGLIDIYYNEEDDSKDEAERKRKIFFEFTSGSVNAANYLVDHNADKHRIRLTLIGTNEDDLRVTSPSGLGYLQAGGITHVLDTEKSGDVPTPFYDINVVEEYAASAVKQSGSGEATPISNVTKGIKSFNLANGYINDDSVISNISPYSTSYIFSKSNLDYMTAYKLSSEQEAKKDKIRINYELPIGSVTFKDGAAINVVENSYTETTRQNRRIPITRTYTFSGPVRVVYQFSGTNSETLDALDENAGGIESIASKIFMAIGDSFVRLANLGGSDGTNNNYYVTIDSLVFNEYPNTIVDFFGDTNYTNAAAKEIINFWFKAFKMWAIAIYIIMLIYIGIKTMFVSGTAEQKNVKLMLEGWLQGLLLMFLLPFLFKYLIIINDAFVDIMRVNSKYSVYAYYTFEEEYSTIWGQEDGEDSTTSVIEKLRNAKANLQVEINQINEDLDAYDDIIDDLMKDRADSEAEKESGDKAFLAKSEAIRNTLSTHPGWKIVRTNADGTEKEYSVDEVISYFSNNFRTYYNSNREKFLTSLRNTKNFSTSDFYSEQIQFGKEFSFRNSSNEVDGDLILNELINGIRDYYDNDILIASYEEDIERETKRLQEKTERLNKINAAIEKAENNDTDILGEMRRRAGKTSRFYYVVVWLILLFEVVILLIIYYKRLFMLAILIAIFPLVTVAYVYEKARTGRPSILRNWMQEFTVNVFIQSIHAIMYVTLVEAGYAVFVSDNDNWLIFMMAILAMIYIEPVVKQIMGLRGSTVVDLAKYTTSAAKLATAAVAVGTTITSTRGDLKSIDNKAKNKEASTQKKQVRNDNRLNTIRQARINRINSNTKLTDKEKKDKLSNMKDKMKVSDKTREAVRKKVAAARRLKTRAAKIGRVTANLSSAVGTVAGGIAAGGGMDDFMSAASITKGITGSGNKVKLSDDAKKAANKVNVENKIGNVTTDNQNSDNGSALNPNYNGNSYDDYSYDTAPAPIEEPKTKSVLGGKFRSAMNTLGNKINPVHTEDTINDQKLYINTTYNIKEENEKK